MKTRLFGFFMALSVSFAGIGVASAQGLTDTTDVKVPFNFYVGDQEMPAGNYQIQMDTDANALTIREQNGSAIASIPAQSEKRMTEVEKPALIFDQYGDNQNFLRSVSDGEAALDLQLPKSNLEKSLPQGQGKPRTITSTSSGH